MKEKDYQKLMSSVDQRYIREVHERESQAWASKKKGIIEMSKKAVLGIGAAAAASFCIVGSLILMGRQPSEPIADPAASQPAESTLSAESTTSFSEEPNSMDPVQVADGIYRIGSIPKPEKVELSCKYGKVHLNEDPKVRAYGKDIDFSAFPYKYSDYEVPYCICDEGNTVYFVDYVDVYRSDPDMDSPELLLTFFGDNDEQPDIVTELIAFPNTDLLFFRGGTNTGYCIGSIDPKTSDISLTICGKNFKTVPCSSGVMLYCYTESNIAYYWECGKIYEIPINNSREGELGAWVSVNGKYMCTQLWGKSEDDHLVERYTVYDTKTGELLKSFDWTFETKKVGDNLPTGFIWLDLNEETESVYLLNDEDGEVYQFCFGG